MFHASITRCTRLAALCAALVATPAAMAFVTTTTVGNTTTYFEDFNGGSEFGGDAWTPIGPPSFSDNFIELSGSAGSVSWFAFTSAAAISSLNLSFYYVGALDNGNGTVSLTRIEDNGAWSTYHLSTLGDTPGVPAAFSGVNPGPTFSGSDTPGDAFFSLTLNNLPAGIHLLAFERLVPQAIGDPFPQLRVDDILLTVTAVPEPGRALMLCAGLAGLAAWRRRRVLAK